MRSLAFVLLAVLLSPVAVAQEIYRWVDKNGVVHFSDQPGPGAERITVSGQIARTPAEAEPPDLYSSPPTRSPPAQPYQSLAITRPSADEVFFGTDYTVAVDLALDPQLRPGDTVALYLDGRRVPTSGLSAMLSGVPRGSHVLRAEVVDGSGNTLVASPQVTFHVRQASIANPPVGPALRPPQPRPPPRPTPAPRSN